MKAQLGPYCAQQQCSECQMLFTLPLENVSSGCKAMEILGAELDRHMRQTHEPDLPSAWRGEED